MDRISPDNRWLGLCECQDKIRTIDRAINYNPVVQGLCLYVRPIISTKRFHTHYYALMRAMFLHLLCESYKCNCCMKRNREPCRIQLYSSISQLLTELLTYKANLIFDLYSRGSTVILYIYEKKGLQVQ